jgi:hypothetical protein
MYDGKKCACNLKPGDIIAPPAHERKWLWRDGVRRMMRVKGVVDGNPDKRGPWLHVTASYPTPYGAEDTVGVFRMRPESVVQTIAP